jgi:hypothetical protein
MRMDLAGERFQVEEGYEVHLPPCDHLIVVAGALLGETGYNFDHPNIAAKKSGLFEFKHYRKGGSKFWTSRAGISFYFVIPKAQIEMLPEKGYSYVPVLIHGRKCRLNVSGGTSNGGWTDYVREVAHVGSGWTVSALKALAAVAMSPEECHAPGITLEIQGLEDHQSVRFAKIVAAVTMRTRLKPGSQLLLNEGWSHDGSHGPVEIQSRPLRKRYFICSRGPSRDRIQYAAIDWGRTAELNGVTVPGPVLVNRIGPILARTPV